MLPTSVRCISLLAAVLLLCAVGNAIDLRGRVVDESGALIPGARVQLISRGQTFTTISDSTGMFTFAAFAGPGTLHVSAPGFSPATLELNQSLSAVSVTLKLAPVGETVVVTGERNATPIERTAANVTVLAPAELKSRATPTLDDALRQVPGFTLFRRSNSLTANPTTQGASARGVGASGASRVLVLEDGSPLNDAFGGWVFWDRVSRIALDHVEVLRGGGSALYGSSAFGGVVDISTRGNGDLATVETSGDSLHGHDVEGIVSHQLSGWSLLVNGEMFGNDGTFVVASSDRGLVDTPAALRFANGTVRAQHSLGSTGSAFVSAGLFAERRNNGTALQINSTHLGEFRSGMDVTLGRNVFSVRVYGTGEHYHQSFSAIAPDRNSETLTRWQTAPSDQAGFSADWMRPIFAAQLTVGMDGRFIHGESDEAIFVANTPSGLSAGGGRNNLLGGFAELSAPIVHHLRASAGVRTDTWWNLDGFNRTTQLNTGATTLVALSSHQETAFSPRAGVVYDLAARWQLTASAYGGFRAPTLNELYRSFRLGNVLTLANGQLQAEHIHGGETGIRYLRGQVMLSGTFFQENVDDPVSNITQSATASLITRQRQNLGGLRARGADADAVLILRPVQLRAGYEYVHSVVTSFSANPVLVGKIVPQVPAHLFTMSTVYTAPRHWTVVALLRAASRQFDDDLNQFELQPYSVLGLSVSKQTGLLTWFASAANVLDARVQTAATPVVNYASPRIISGGLRATLAKW